MNKITGYLSLFKQELVCYIDVFHYNAVCQMLPALCSDLFYIDWQIDLLPNNDSITEET
jgi:hypothetical protein